MCSLEVPQYAFQFSPVILVWFIRTCVEKYHRNMYVLKCPGTHEQKLCHYVVECM